MLYRYNIFTFKLEGVYSQYSPLSLNPSLLYTLSYIHISICSILLSLIPPPPPFQLYCISPPPPPPLSLHPHLFSSPPPWMNTAIPEEAPAVRSRCYGQCCQLLAEFFCRMAEKSAAKKIWTLRIFNLVFWRDIGRQLCDLVSGKGLQFYCVRCTI